jgi:hypothetical protein
MVMNEAPDASGMRVTEAVSMKREAVVDATLVTAR